MPEGKLLVYLFRPDLRVSDNAVLHHLAVSADHGFTHLLPVYVFPARQIEISGFLKDREISPYPRAVSQVAKFWRCGPHRAKFIAQSVWSLKSGLEEIGSGLVLRVGDAGDVIHQLIRHFKDDSLNVAAVWMTEDVSPEEVQEQDAVAAMCSNSGVDFRLWLDEKYFVDDRDTGLAKPQDLPDVFTTYCKSQEPLHEKPRPALPAPEKSALPPLPDHPSIPAQKHPFVMPETLEGLEVRLIKPIDNILVNPPKFPDGARSAHPTRGGESRAHERLQHLIMSGAMTKYKDTRNGLIGPDFSTKLSGYLSLGCISARQIHNELMKFEDGMDKVYEKAEGYGHGENEGTNTVRYQLVWRDYMRLCTKKFGQRLFGLSGFQQSKIFVKQWKTADRNVALPEQNPSVEKVAKILERFLEGTTGMGLIDASQRELFHTGYTSNRARQNVASFLARHLEIDWRYGAEWYEMWLMDYDVSSNWSNWQYVAGVGNDPRGDARIFNPVKQAFDYDKEGHYVRTWIPEVKDLEKPENVFQPWTANQEDLERYSLTNSIMVTDPVKRIKFVVHCKDRRGRRGRSGRNRHGGRPSSAKESPDGITGEHGASPAQVCAGSTPQTYHQFSSVVGLDYPTPLGAHPQGYGPRGWYANNRMAGRRNPSYYREGRGNGHVARGGFSGSYQLPSHGYQPLSPLICPQQYTSLSLPYPPPYPPPSADYAAKVDFAAQKILTFR